MQDLGLPFWRKKNWFKELFSPYGPEDYRGVVREWRRSQQGKSAKGLAGANGSGHGTGNGNGWEHVEANDKTKLLVSEEGEKGHRHVGSGGV